MSAQALALRLRLAARSAGPVALAACIVIVLAGGALAWTQVRQRALARTYAARLAALAAAPAVVPAPVAADNGANLKAFYAALGERRYREQQVRSLFALAAKAGLTLAEGEYSDGYDARAQLHTYQVALPVSGPYRAVWQFALSALAAIPFASLDDISFRRDAIGDANVSARVRLTFYLSAGGAP